MGRCGCGGPLRESIQSIGGVPAQTAVARRSGESTGAVVKVWAAVAVVRGGPLRESIGGVPAQTAVARRSGESTGAVKVWAAVAVVVR
jgi:hypothetical protein